MGVLRETSLSFCGRLEPRADSSTTVPTALLAPQPLEQYLAQIRPTCSSEGPLSFKFLAPTCEGGKKRIFTTILTNFSCLDFGFPFFL